MNRLAIALITTIPIAVALPVHAAESPVDHSASTATANRIPIGASAASTIKKQANPLSRVDSKAAKPKDDNRGDDTLIDRRNKKADTKK